MSHLLQREPYSPRDEAIFLDEMNALTEHHLSGSPTYRSIWPDWRRAEVVNQLPFVHVGLFKYLDLKTHYPGIERQRVLESSATTGTSSKIALDAESSALQTESSSRILANFLGDHERPLLILDSPRSLVTRGSLSARVAAAMSLKVLASEVHFLLDDPNDPTTMRWNTVEKAAAEHDELLVYGFSWILWSAWGGTSLPAEVANALRDVKVYFVHSGGWKKLESQQVDHKLFDQQLLNGVGSNSMVVDYYGLVEQIGIVYPLCEHGYRHVPVWAEVIVRDSYTLEPLIGQPGQIQLLNTLALGAPYHSVLTEDLGVIIEETCPCGRSGRRFELLGRIPKAEVRGCANV